MADVRGPHRTARGRRASPVAGSPQVLQRWPDRLTTTMDIDPAEPVLEGHFPGFAIFPGVCLIECAHQTALLALAEREEPAEHAELAALETVRFRTPVYPGDQVLIEVDVLPLDDGWRCPARVLVCPQGSSGERAVAAELKLRYRNGAAPSVDVDGLVARTTDGHGGGGRTYAMNATGIKQLLPHRHPMLLIDRILATVPGQSLVATKAVTSNELWYAGLPDDSDHAYPSVLLAESWCQAAGVLVCAGEPNPDVLTGKVTLFGSISGLRLLRPVYPGDLVRHTVRLVRAVSDAAMLAGEATVDGVRVMEVDSIIIALRASAGLRSR